MEERIESAGAWPIATSPADEKSSMFYSMLPRLVRLRLRRISSIRRSVGAYATGYEPEQSDDYAIRSRASSDPTTPPPGYTSRISLSGPVHDDVDRATSKRNSESPCAGRRNVDGHSGIRWKFANQGLSLLDLAAREDDTTAQSARDQDPNLSRQLYVHGVTYLLRGLPTDLSTDEKLSVWAAVPPKIHELSPVASSAAGEASNDPANTMPTEHSSSLQRIIATLIVQLFIFINLIWPYIRHLLAFTYQWERKHRVSERVIASTIQSCESVVDVGIQLSTGLSRVNDGKVAQAFNDVMIWGVKGVTGGIHQGIGDGLVAIGAENAGKIY